MHVLAVKMEEQRVLGFDHSLSTYKLNLNDQFHIIFISLPKPLAGCRAASLLSEYYFAGLARGIPYAVLLQVCPLPALIREQECSTMYCLAACSTLF
jgi:hypothetical protein